MSRNLGRRSFAVAVAVATGIACLACASAPPRPEIRIADAAAGLDCGEFPQQYVRIVREWLDADIPKPGEDGVSLARLALDEHLDVSEPARAEVTTRGAGWLVHARTYAARPDVMAEIHYVFLIRDGRVVYDNKPYWCYRKAKEGLGFGFKGGERMCVGEETFPGGKALQI